MQIIRKKDKLREAIEAAKKKGNNIAFVPTMGALHSGHTSLVKKAQELADIVVVSIFVNPTQFGPKEDFNKYPRPEKDDIRILEDENVDIAYLPSAEEIYPDGTRIHTKAGKNSDILCGASRPRHFDGVVTVVKRLFEHITPDIALFGEKDFQQLWLINHMVKKENIKVKVIGMPIIREEDGLALSSRNRYLSKKERQIAPEIFHAMEIIKQRLYENDATISDLEEWGREYLIEKGFSSVDYIEIRDEETLEKIFKLVSPARIFVAARIGKTRLIDNIEVNP